MVKLGAEQKPHTRLTFYSRFEPRVRAVTNDQKPHSWVRSILIGFAIFAAWFVVGVATYQESPDDTPMIVSLFSK